MKRRCSGLSPGSRTGSMRRANGTSPPGSPGAAIFPTAASARRGDVTSCGGAGGRIQSEGRGQRRLASAAAAAGAGRRAVGCEAQRAAEAHSDWPAGAP